MTFILGLTGSIATGKSTLAQMFRKKRIPVIDADKIVHQLQDNNSIMLKAIVTKFGTEILNVEGKLNRRRLSEVIFNDVKKKQCLDKIQDPFILEAILQELQQMKQKKQSLVVVDLPLLYEKNYENYVDAVMVSFVPEQQEYERLMKRDNLSFAKARNLVSQQIPIAQKKTWADIVIDNSQSPSFSEKQIDSWLKKVAINYDNT